jgi:hypothetical protein
MPIFATSYGEVQEWLNWHAWKVCILEKVSRVRIPSSPQFVYHILLKAC